MTGALAPIEMYIGDELPARSFVWAPDGTAIDFVASPHTFTVHTKARGETANLTGSTITASGAANGTVTLSFAAGWSDALTAGTYRIFVRARRTADSFDQTAQIELRLKAGVAP